MKKFLLPAIAGLALMVGLTSCNQENTPIEYFASLDFNLPNEDYNDYNVWKYAYDPEITFFGQYPYIFLSHYAQQEEYDGVKYQWFTGFCPSKVEDNSEHSEDWINYQFAAYPVTGGQGYVVAHWDVRENESTPIDDRSCIIRFGMTARPVSITIANTSYSYWVMKNGSAFSKPFGPTDWLALDIYGIRGEQSFFAKTEYLAKDGTINDNWKTVDLSDIGEVDMLYFTMRSSDSGEYGMNNPAYFAIGVVNAYFTAY